eukprot:6200160-Pleurochrysis_carterae.AAC.6
MLSESRVAAPLLHSPDLFSMLKKFGIHSSRFRQYGITLCETTDEVPGLQGELRFTRLFVNVVSCTRNDNRSAMLGRRVARHCRYYPGSCLLVLLIFYYAFLYNVGLRVCARELAFCDRSLHLSGSLASVTNLNELLMT